MATILELAERADVSAENVLRVLHGEPVSEDVERRVRDAVEALGPPAYPRPAEVLPALSRPGADAFLTERLRAATAELEAALPEGVGTVVYEALRVEVRPVAQHVAELAALFQHMLQRLERVGDEVNDERRERAEDVALLTELITSGWRSVDRRLARLEQIVARIESGRNGRGGARVYQLDDAAGGRTAGE